MHNGPASRPAGKRCRRRARVSRQPHGAGRHGAHPAEPGELRRSLPALSE